MATKTAAPGEPKSARSSVLVLALSLAFAALSVASQVHAQTPDTFEVASIRPNFSGGDSTQINVNDGRLVVTHGSLKSLIRNAYGLLSFQFVGGPNWLDSAKFDITAETSRREKISQDQLKVLLQGSLADRFQLKAHLETRQEPVYALVTDKNGPKLAKAAADEPGSGMNTHRESGRGIMKGTNVQMSELATNLDNQLGRFVIDRTGLEGHYEFLLEWGADQTQDSDGPSLFTAVREQLGLRLEAQKAPVQVLVIDSAKKPSEN